jgi:hypothetical protein
LAGFNEIVAGLSGAPARLPDLPASQHPKCIGVEWELMSAFSADHIGPALDCKRPRPFVVWMTTTQQSVDQILQHRVAFQQVSRYLTQEFTWVLVTINVAKHSLCCPATSPFHLAASRADDTNRKSRSGHASPRRTASEMSSTSHPPARPDPVSGEVKESTLSRAKAIKCSCLSFVF